MSDRKISETGIYQSSNYVRKSSIVLIIFGVAATIASFVILTEMNDSNVDMLIIIEAVMLPLFLILLGASNLIILKKAKDIDDSKNHEKTVIVNPSKDPSIKYISFIEYEHTCPSCGTQLEDGAIFCTKCGAKQN